MEHTLNVSYVKKPLPKGLAKWAMILIIVGLVGVALSVFTAHDMGQRALFACNLGMMFTLSIGAGAMFFVAIEHLMGSIWSVPFRRVAEIMTNALWLVPIFAAPIIWNVVNHHVDMFHWTHLSYLDNPSLAPEGFDMEALKADKMLQNKAPYLNESGFMMRSIIIWAAFILLRTIIVGNSYKQDRLGGQKINKANAWLSAVFLLFFAVGLTLFSIDYIMSLEPHWFSTIFGLYYFAGTFNAFLALLTLLVLSFNERNLLIGGINKDHYYSLGALMFAFTAFWMYMAFSQFMLIWYANIPEETFWFMPRMEGGFMYVSIGLIFIKFIIPFGMLIQRPAKMDPTRLRVAAIWILAAHVYDLYWLIYPTYAKVLSHHDSSVSDSTAIFGWQELSFIALAVGLILLVISIAGRKRDLVAWNDPKLERGLNFHL